LAHSCAAAAAAAAALAATPADSVARAMSQLWGAPVMPVMVEGGGAKRASRAGRNERALF